MTTVDRCLFKGPFNETTWFGIPGLNIAMLVIFSGIVAKTYKLNQVGAFLFTFIVGFVLYKLFCINTIFSEVIVDGIPGLT